MSGKTIVYSTNVVAFAGQFGTAIALTVLVLTDTLALRIPLTQTYLLYDDAGKAASQTLAVGSLNPTWLLVAMCALTALHHGLVLIPQVFRVYYDIAVAGFNVFAWIEYAFTSSLMTLVLLLLTGVSELSTAIPLASLLGFTNLLGGFLPEMIDYVTRRRLPKWLVLWTPFGLTGLLSQMPWVTIVVYFAVSAVRSDVAVPLWLWFSFAGTYFNFNSFAFIFLGQHLEPEFALRRKWIWPASYAGASLFSKLYLTWFFAGGILSRS